MRHLDRWTRTAASLGAALLFALGAAGTAQAQAVDAPKWTIDGRGGVALPTGDLADLALEDVGPSFGLGVGYHVHPRVAVRADGELSMFAGDDVAAGGTGPDVSLLHYTAGVDVELTRPGAGPWDLTANVGAGATTWDTDEFIVDGTADELSETYPTANGGLRLGYDVTRNVNVFAGGQWYLQFADESETAPLAETAGLTEGFDTASTMPIYAGLELTF